MAAFTFVTLVVALGALLIGRVVYFAYQSVRKWQGKPKRRIVHGTRCRCGYEMDQLDTVRCPECGRVSGFDATSEALALTDEQLRRAKARRDARRAAEADA